MRFNQSVTQVSLYTWLTLITGFILFFQITVYTRSACIIIHGTWAQNETWYRPFGEFFQAVQSTAQELAIVDEVIPFSWSGQLGYLAHLQAAQELETCINQYDWVILIAHSHGATVGMISCQNLFDHCTNGNNFGKVKKFYALGVPVLESTITPSMKIIEKFYNLFSFGDLVQTVNGTCERRFCMQERLINLSVQLFDLHPSHSQLHHPAIGKDLLKIDEYLMNKRLQGFENFDFNRSAAICFYPYKLPVYKEQLNQDSLIQADKDAHRLATLAFFRHKIK